MDRFERKIGGEPKRQPARQDKTVPSFQPDGLGHAFDDQPALSGEHGIALDALVPGEVDGHIVGHHKAAGGQALGLEQSKNLRKRIHTPTRSDYERHERRFKAPSAGFLFLQDE